MGYSRPGTCATCADICMDMRSAVAIHMRADTFMDVCMDVFMDVCMDVCMGVCIDVFMDVCMDVCMDMRMDVRADVRSGVHLRTQRIVFTATKMRTHSSKEEGWDDLGQDDDMPSQRYCI